MDDPEILTTLRRLPHFAALAPEVLARVAGCCRGRSAERGEVLFARGEPAGSFFVLREGGVKLVRLSPEGREHVVKHVAPGTSFAEAALLALGRYPVDAVATETSLLVVVEGAAFLRLLREEERLAPAMIASLSMRLATLVERVEELSLVQAGARLSRWLLRQPASGPSERLSIDLSLAKRELAAELAMTPETLSRILRRWQDQGWIESERGRIVVLDADRLAAVGDEGLGDSPGGA